MAFNIAYTYQLIDKYTAPIQKIIAATRAHTRYLKENKAAIALSNAALLKMSANTGKFGTAVTRLSNRSERLNNSLGALQHNNAFDHLTTQAKGFNDQLDRMNRIRPNIPGMGPGPGQAIPGAIIPGARHPQAITHVGRAERFSRFGAAASGLTGIGVTAGITSVLKQTAAVENAMIDMGRATDLPAEQLKKFEERFMSLSEQIGISTDKLAIMAFEGSKTGIDNTDLDKYVKLTANASVAFEVLEEEAGRALGSIKTKMGLNIDQLGDMMDRVNFVADKTSADGERMINIMERLSGTFNSLKLPPSIAAGLTGVADQLERSPELAASGMQMVINKMMKSKTLAKKMFDNPVETMRSVFGKLARIAPEKQIMVATKMFGDEAGRFAVKMANNMKVFDETMKMAASKDAMGSMEREMQSKLKSLTMLWDNMKNAVTNVMVAIGEGLAPDIKRFGEYLREITPRIRDFVREHPKVVKFAAAVSAVVAAITLAVPIAFALGAAFSFIGAAIGLISAPIAIAAGILAGFAWRWKEWVKNGHPVPKLIAKISDRIGRLVDRFNEIMKNSDGANRAIDLAGKAFDALGHSLVIPLTLLEKYLQLLQWIIGAQDEIKPIGVLAGAGANIGGLTPPSITSALDLGKIIGKGPEPSTVSGTITVKAEPGTSAKISQPNLPTGSNLLTVKKK